MEKKQLENQLEDGWIPKERYVFVSYASRDWAQVYPTVLALRARGINVYIDKEFQENPSESWLLNLRERLSDAGLCCGMVAFISMNYMRSYACLIEQLMIRTRQVKRRMGEPLPAVYISLEEHMDSIQGMKELIYRHQAESNSEKVQIAAGEAYELRQCLTSRYDGPCTPEEADGIVVDMRTKHDVATYMYELIFEHANEMIQPFLGVERCAEWLARVCTDTVKSDRFPLAPLTPLEALSGGTRKALVSAPSPAPYLIRRRGSERIPLNREVFRLGRDAANDYVLAGNRYIGHTHCHIICRDGKYFVVDDHARNYTKLNGVRLTPGAEAQLNHGDRIGMADEEFEFKLF